MPHNLLMLLVTLGVAGLAVLVYLLLLWVVLTWGNHQGKGRGQR